MGFDGLDFDGVDSTMAIIWISIQIEGFQFKGFDHGDGCIGFRFEGFDGWISMGSMDSIPSNLIMAIPFQIRPIRPWPSAGLRFRRFRFRFDAIPILQYRFESNHSCLFSIPTVPFRLFRFRLDAIPIPTTPAFFLVPHTNISISSYILYVLIKKDPSSIPSSLLIKKEPIPSSSTPLL